jgi:hypothetical protein
LARDNEGIKKSLKEFDECLEKYIPVKKYNKHNLKKNKIFKSLLKK